MLNGSSQTAPRQFHNILLVLLLPTGMTLLLALPGLLLRTKALCWAGLVVLWLASTFLVGDTAMRAAEGRQGRVPMAALPSSQAMVVVSGMRVAPPGDAPLGEWSEAVDRVAAGMALFQAGKAPVLVCTGGWVPWYPGARPEGEILAERAAVLGVPRSHRLVTTGSSFANRWGGEKRRGALRMKRYIGHQGPGDQCARWCVCGALAGPSAPR